VGKQATFAGLAVRYEAHPNQGCAWKKQQQGPAMGALDEPGSVETAHERDIGRLPRSPCGARFFSQKVRKMSAPDRRAMLDRRGGAPGSAAMRAAECGALGRLQGARTGERQRRRADASDRRAVHRLALGSRRITAMLRGVCS
jgi:hypothetical protein